MTNARWIFSLLLVVGAVHGTEPQQIIYGDWVITRELAASSAIRLSGDEIEALLGAGAHYAADEVSFAGEHCQRPVFDSYRETAHSLMQSRELLVDDLQLHDAVALAIEIGCADGNDEFGAGTWLLIASPDRLITEVDGVYFELRRLPTASP